MSPAEGCGRLLVVGTPIGNLQDLSPRVGEALGAADAVLCEDTRVTGKLLNHLGLRKPLERCDENVIGRRAAGLVERLLAGETLAFASDAGMPGVSDPGQVLVDAALDAGVPVEVVPGPSAVVCAVAASGLPCASFFFGGFLPRKAGEKAARLDALASVPGALVFYESPHRVTGTLAAIAGRFPLRRVALVRELTKVHEECRRGPAPELAVEVAADEAAGRPVRGECVLVVEGPVAGEDTPCPGAEDPEGVARELLEQGFSASKAAKELAKRSGMARSDAYALLLSLKQ